MRLWLVGADFEENLGVGMIAAAAEAGGHEVTIVPFNAAREAPAVARGIAAAAPDVVGLSIQFQHRAGEFLALARRLRAEGFRGHLTCGGQLPTLADAEVLAEAAIDTIVLHEGERTIVELLDALSRGRPLHEVAGLALRADDGAPVRTAGRPLEDLDALPFPRRYRSHTRHMGVPFIPILGGRGCWGACSYCAITSFYRDARAHGGGRTVRLRSPQNVATEMALLADAAGGRAVFCFHDDNFLLPRPSDTVARVRAIRAALAAQGIDQVALIGKARPDCLSAELARELAALGVVRLYVGVENASAGGALHLGRARQGRDVERALAACRQAGIFTCYNLLVFEPGATLDDVRDNVAFIREHAGHPVNFCRAEPYSGTPLQRGLADAGNLEGDLLGWGYRIADDTTELLFRVCAAAFRQRNFAPDGVGNRYMGLGYSAKLLQTFHDDGAGRSARLSRRADELTRAIALDTARFLDEALDLVVRVGTRDRDRVARETALLGLRVAAADRTWHLAMDELERDMLAFADAAGRQRPASRPTRRLRDLARHLALGASLGFGVAGCDCGYDAVDPAPPSDAGQDAQVVDPPPPDAGLDAGVVDPVPLDAGLDAGDAGLDATIADPPPADFEPHDGGMSDACDAAPTRAPLLDQFRDTAPRLLRSTDLALHAPPSVTLQATSDGAGGVRVRIAAGPAPLSTRWEADGDVDGEGREVTWRPASPSDQLRLAVRSAGGVAVVALRARDVGAS